AWPELYFTGLGWLRFEPTPGGAHGQGTAVQPSYAITGTSGRAGGTRGGATGPGPNPSSSSGRPNILKRILPPPGAGSGSLPPVGTTPLTHAGAPLPVGQIAIALLVLLAIGSVRPGAARIVTRHRRWRAAIGDFGLANAAWQEICADLD